MQLQSSLEKHKKAEPLIEGSKLKWSLQTDS